jgi:hypothetical protein
MDGADILAAVFLATVALLALGVALVVFKLTHIIAWSWLWVTLPFWGPLTLATTLISLLFVFALALLWLE